MSYSIYDVNGYVDDLASNNGFMQLSRAIPAGPVKELFDTGEAEITPEILEAIKAVPAPADSIVAGTLENFKQVAAKCEGIIIISDGTGIEDESNS